MKGTPFKTLRSSPLMQSEGGVNGNGDKSKIQTEKSTYDFSGSSGTAGSTIADLFSPASIGGTALSVFPISGKGVSRWLTKSTHGKKLLNKVPGLARWFQPSKVVKNRPIDFSGSKDFGGGKVPKSLTAPKETKLLAGDQYKYTHMTQGGKYATTGEQKNLSNQLESMFKPIGNTHITNGVEVYDDVIWFSSSGSSKYGPKRYKQTKMEEGVGGKTTKSVGYNKAEKMIAEQFAVAHKQLVKDFPIPEYMPGGDNTAYTVASRRFQNAEFKLLQKYNRMQEAVQDKITQSFHQIDITLDPKANIKKMTEGLSYSGIHAKQRVWSRKEIDAIRKQGFDGFQLVDDMGHDIETVIWNKDIITPAAIDGMETVTKAIN